jgi:hypothetical protein
LGSGNGKYIYFIEGILENIHVEAASLLGNRRVNYATNDRLEYVEVERASCPVNSMIRF